MVNSANAIELDDLGANEYKDKTVEVGNKKYDYVFTCIGQSFTLHVVSSDEDSIPGDSSE